MQIEMCMLHIGYDIQPEITRNNGIYLLWSTGLFSIFAIKLCVKGIVDILIAKHQGI